MAGNVLVAALRRFTETRSRKSEIRGELICKSMDLIGQASLIGGGLSD